MNYVERIYRQIPVNFCDRELAQTIDEASLKNYMELRLPIVVKSRKGRKFFEHIKDSLPSICIRGTAPLNPLFLWKAVMDDEEAYQYIDFKLSSEEAWNRIFCIASILKARSIGDDFSADVLTMGVNMTGDFTTADNLTTFESCLLNVKSLTAIEVIQELFYHEAWGYSKRKIIEQVQSGYLLAFIPAPMRAGVAEPIVEIMESLPDNTVPDVLLDKELLSEIVSRYKAERKKLETFKY